MIKFLKGTEILESARRLIAEGDSVDLAVAYWGKGAADDLQLEKAKGQVRIVCDLLSGGCNPKEIKTLKKIKGVTVRALKGLHAKVYFTSKTMMVGSANASANGLGREGQVGLLEAAVLTSEAPQLGSAKKWFNDEVWGGSEEITPAMMKQGQNAWVRQQVKPPTGLTLLRVLLEDPTFFEGRAYLTYYFSPPSKAALRVARLRKNRYFSQKQLEDLGDEEPWVYDLSRKGAVGLAKDDSVLDLDSECVLTIVGLEDYEEKGKAYTCVLLKEERPRDGVLRIQGVRVLVREIKLLKNAIEYHQASQAKKKGKALTVEEKDFGCNLNDLRKDAPDAYRYLKDHITPPSKMLAS